MGLSKDRSALLHLKEILWNVKLQIDLAVTYLKIVENLISNTTAASKYKPKRLRININWNPHFLIPFYLVKFFPQCAHLSYRNKIQILKGLFFEVWKGGFQQIQILGLLSIYFDAVVVFVKKFSILLRLSWATVWPGRNLENASHNNLNS